MRDNASKRALLMAGPLSSEEIEDVVSSVRRLVSNEMSPRRLSRDLAAERLLLTPSLRVVSETSPLAPLVLGAALESRIDAPQETPAASPELVDAEATADGSVELVEAEWEDELWAQPEVVSLGEVALAAEEAEVLLPPAEDAEMLVVEAEDLPEPWAEVGSDWVEDEPIAFMPHRHRSKTLGTAPAAEAAPVGDALSEAPHDAVEEVAPRLDTPAAALADSRAEETVSQRMPTEIIDADGTPLAVLDEAALQEIVRQMIREELQGDLGERITRNVRKLVRAEINRALIARDLD